MATGGKYPGLAKHVQLGSLFAKNRVFMASLTRNRSVRKWPISNLLHFQLTPEEAETVANDDNVIYYQQRAKSGGAGLIFSEGILVTPQGTEWPNAPGIWDDQHAQGWRKVVDAVHGEGTPIVAQLWHVGRVAHPDMEEQKKAGVPVYGPSAVAARGGKVNYTRWCFIDFSFVNSMVSQDISHLLQSRILLHFSTSSATLQRWRRLRALMVSSCIQLMDTLWSSSSPT